MEKCGGVWRGVERHDEAWGGMERRGEAWEPWRGMERWRDKSKGCSKANGEGIKKNILDIKITACLGSQVDFRRVCRCAVPPCSLLHLGHSLHLRMEGGGTTLP